MITRLIELADDRKDIIRELRSYHNIYLDHLIKIYFMRENQELNHWIKEVWNFYRKIERLRNNKLPKESLIFQHICGWIEDSLEDKQGKGIILGALYDYNFIKEIDYTDIDNFRDFFIEYSDFVVKSLNEQGFVEPEEAKSLIMTLLNDYNY